LTMLTSSPDMNAATRQTPSARLRESKSDARITTSHTGGTAIMIPRKMGNIIFGGQ
jgi:hypothetical protein